mgnify:CR=1 FL=1
MDIKNKKRGTLTIIGTLCFILICGFIVVTVVLNNNIIELDNSRNTYLDTRERAKEWVSQEVINYLNSIDKTSWEHFRESSYLDEYARNQIYGNNFEEFTLPGVSQYMILDTQYTIGEEDYKVYVKTILNINDSKRETVFIATIRENKITNMVVY